jgi:hypothetical protein
MIYLHNWACFHFEACALVVRVRIASLAELRMRICYQNNGGLNISKRENIKLWRDFSPNCAPVSLGEQRILIK